MTNADELLLPRKYHIPQLEAEEKRIPVFLMKLMELNFCHADLEGGREGEGCGSNVTESHYFFYQVLVDFLD